MVVGFTAIPVQSELVTTEVLSSNPAHAKVFSTQHCVIRLSVTRGGTYLHRGTVTIARASTSFSHAKNNKQK